MRISSFLAGITARDTGKARPRRIILFTISVMAAAFGAALGAAAVMWLWDLYDHTYGPPLDYDAPPADYIVNWLFLGIVFTAYGFTIGQALHWLSRRRKTRKLLIFVIANLLCGGALGLLLNYLAGPEPANDGGYNALVDAAFAIFTLGGGGALWSLIFFAVRRPDRDAPKDISASVF